ncbi:MAG TPA: dihydropteroate synthase [Dongiaceae bacterium]|nr:dihydropteroate synthase [Dongiaceae bacterium]
MPLQTELPETLPAGARLYVRPLGLLHGEVAAAMIAAGKARPLAGGPLAFPVCELILRTEAKTRRVIASLPEIEGWRGGGTVLQERLDLLSKSRPDAMARPRLMGIVNVTPDSFSDAGESLDPEAALTLALAHAQAGAAILDIGGESTRPGATAIDVATEIGRVAPVLERLVLHPGLELSIDTRHAAVMRHALALGVRIINDVSALSDDPESLPVAAASSAQIVLMHKRGEPKEMNIAPRYEDVALDVFDEIETRVNIALAAGIDRARLIIDPGIGFAKRSKENLALLRALALFHGLGCPLLLGVSRKALIGGEQRSLAPKERLPGSLAAAMHALDRGVQILRVHDVRESRQLVDLWTRLNHRG